MSRYLRTLIVEDSEEDTLLLVRELAREGYTVTFDRVETAEAMLSALNTKEWDLVLADYHLPRFSGLAALKLLQDSRLDLPFIIVSGVVGEETAVEAMRLGAHDYVLKGNLTRLNSVIVRELNQAENRRQLSAERKRSREEQQLIASVFGNSSEGILITDPQGTILRVNRRVIEVSGYSEAELIGENPRIFSSGRHDRSYYEKMWSDLCQHGSWQGELWNRRKDGGLYPEWLSITAVTAPDGEVTHYIGIFSDTTERKRAAEALRESEERYVLALDGINDGVWDWKLVTDEVYFSSRWKAMLGYSNGEIGSSPEELFSRIHPLDLPETKTKLQAHIAGKTEDLQCEFRIRNKVGAYVWVLCRGKAITDDAGTPTRLAGSLTNIHRRKLLQHQVRRDSLHDKLTGLINRIAFVDRVGQVIQRAKRDEATGYAVIVIGIDRFNLINDGFSPIAGDQILCDFSKRLLEIAPAESLARFGGDEFAILLESELVPHTATEMAETIHRVLRRPFQIGEAEVYLSVSIGIAFQQPGDDTVEHLLRGANIALQRAELNGRGRTEIYDEQMHSESLKRVQLATDLRKALQHDEFQLYYQPIVTLSDGQIVGFEALVRWIHPTKGFVSPGDFIPVAEETGLIVQLDRWVLAEACRQLEEWKRQLAGQRGLTISVNCSGRLFVEQDMIHSVENTIAETGVDPSSIKLEITETAIMQNPQAASLVLDQLKALHFEISLDDFGTGYSSLAYLQRFPIDVLKIDRAFINQMQSSAKDLEMVRTIMGMATNLSLKVVAEGVETAEQREILVGLGCEYAQGYYFAAPLPPERAKSLLMEQLNG